jgi:hypothetical protein
MFKKNRLALMLVLLIVGFLIYRYYKMKPKFITIIPTPPFEVFLDLPRNNLTSTFEINLIVQNNNGPQRNIVLFDRVSPKFTLDISNGCLISQFGRFKDDPNMMDILTFGIPFQRDINLKIVLNLRKLSIYVNDVLLNSEMLDFVPFLSNEKGIFLENDVNSVVKITKIGNHDGIRLK